MLVRLHKFLADCGVASRRKSEELISQGIVSVNNKPITRLGFLINPDTDEVKVRDRIITKKPDKTYLMINKPPGYITTAKDTHNRKTVLDLIPPLKKRLFPVGRLDKDTTGLLFLTDDGELAFRITHPKFEVIKTYEVLIKGVFKAEDFSVIRKGIEIDAKPHFFKEIKILSQNKNSTCLLVKLTEGKKRQIRIMFESLGYKILKLTRTAIGDIRLGTLKEGAFRELSKEEVESLKRLTGLS